MVVRLRPLRLLMFGHATAPEVTGDIGFPACSAALRSYTKAGSGETQYMYLTLSDRHSAQIMAPTRNRKRASKTDVKSKTTVK